MGIPPHVTHVVAASEAGWSSGIVTDVVPILHNSAPVIELKRTIRHLLSAIVCNVLHKLWRRGDGCSPREPIRDIPPSLEGSSRTFSPFATVAVTTNVRQRPRLIRYS
jgi:hypothetical protein